MIETRLKAGETNTQASRRVGLHGWQGGGIGFLWRVPLFRRPDSSVPFHSDLQSWFVNLSYFTPTVAHLY